jgi:subtilisin family serine protease
VAGILVARGHLQANPFEAYFLTGARGVAPGAMLIVAKAMDARGEGSDDRVAAAIRWALDPDGDPRTDDGADVINLSLGIEEPSSEGHAPSVGSATRAAILDAIHQGVPVVASSGNDGAARVREPGDVPGVLTVGAMDADGHPAGFSNTGPGLALLAPGVLVSTYPPALDTRDFARDGYTAMAGTSMAAPVVAGTLALLLEADPALRHDAANGLPGPERIARLQALLQQTAQPLPGSAAGLLDAQGALERVGAPPRVAWDGVLEVGALALAAAGVGAWLAHRRKRRAAEVAGAPAHPPPLAPAGPVRATVPRPEGAWTLPPAVATPVAPARPVTAAVARPEVPSPATLARPAAYIRSLPVQPEPPSGPGRSS